MRRGIAAAMAGRLQGSGPCWLAASGTRYILYPGQFVPQPVGRVKRFSPFALNSTARSSICPVRTDARSSGSPSVARPVRAVPPGRPASHRLPPRNPTSPDSQLRRHPAALPAPRPFPGPFPAIPAADNRPARCPRRTPRSRWNGCLISVPTCGGSQSRPA